MIDEFETEKWKKALEQVFKEKKEMREAFIIEELQPFFAINGDTITAKDTLRVRLIEIADYKKRVKEAIEKHKYPIMFETTMDENGIKKSVPIEFRVDINVLLKELGLED